MSFWTCSSSYWSIRLARTNSSFSSVRISSSDFLRTDSRPPPERVTTVLRVGGVSRGFLVFSTTCLLRRRGERFFFVAIIVEDAEVVLTFASLDVAFVVLSFPTRPLSCNRSFTFPSSLTSFCSSFASAHRDCRTCCSNCSKHSLVSDSISSLIFRISSSKDPRNWGPSSRSEAPPRGTLILGKDELASPNPTMAAIHATCPSFRLLMLKMRCRQFVTDLDIESTLRIIWAATPRDRGWLRRITSLQRINLPFCPRICGIAACSARVRSSCLCVPNHSPVSDGFQLGRGQRLVQ